MRILRIKPYIALLFMLFSSFVLAATNNNAQSSVGPEQLIQKTADQMIAGLKANQPQLKSNPDIIYKLVKQVVLPNVAVQGMSRAVLGRNTWSTATPAQKQQFVNSFTNLVIGTYASAFAAYTNETVKVFPIRGGVAADAIVAQVKTVIQRSDGPDIPVNYNLVKLNGQWKIYDFSVEGVSLVQSFRTQFASELSNGNLQTLLARLDAHNKRLQNA